MRRIQDRRPITTLGLKRLHHYRVSGTAVHRGDQVPHPYARPDGVGAPPLDTGDRQGDRVLRQGRQVNRRGYTDQSFAASSGTAASPVATCRPCVIRYTLSGRDGHENHHGGCWIAWLRYPVTKQIPTATPSATPRWLVSRVERSRGDTAPARHGPRQAPPGGVRRGPWRAGAFSSRL